ncbi:MAG TPA: LuxR C-terminal-related transcriptional regulator [Pseudonocardiaceae bacterium]|nr:LuxR C-terminal-related transcriptional regulator [Pseudonocardiaceae bacterium]
MSGPTLLATKLAPPLRRGLMHRRRLVQVLDGAARHRLTLLVAPAGWGKTSLLADWHTTGRRQRIGWLALDPEDSDPVRFWNYLISAVRAVLPGVGERALATLSIRGRALYDAALPALINDLATLDEDVHLVLDDYHVLTDPELHRSVAYLLAHQPPRLHLMIATRSDPPLPFARLRAHGEILEIRAKDLAFTDTEATTMLNGALALGLDVADVKRLSARTEGWAAGLYLAGLSLREHPDRAAFVAEFHGTDRFVLDFLGSEVLASQPADLRTFLLETSILPRLSASLCQAVTGRADSAVALERIERSNLFLVPLDSERHWFRYHRLFGELLRHELGVAEPQRVPELHRRAAAWFRAAGQVSEAIDHAAAAGDVDGAAELVAGHWNTWFNAGRLATVEGWLDRLPPGAQLADPRLCVAQAWLLLDTGRLDAVDRWLAGAEAAAADPADAVTLREIAVLRTVHRFKIGDVGASHLAARRVLELIHGEVCFAGTVAYALLGVTLFWKGELAAALRPLTEAVALARRTGNLLGETYALSYLALTHAEQGEVGEGRRVAGAALSRSAEPLVAEHFVTGLGHLAQALALAATGQVEQAAAAAARAVQLARRGGGRLELGLALATHAQALLAAGEDGAPMLAEAKRIVRACRDPGWLPELLTRLSRATTPVGPRLVPDGTAVVAFSDRERQLLPLLAGTLSQREIGAVLHLSLNTVKTHSRMLYRKLGASSRADAVQRARRIGLL